MDDSDLILKAGACQSIVRPLFEQRQDILLRKDIHSAILQAERILHQASKDAQSIEMDARQEGLKKGLQQVAGIIRQAEEQRLEILRQAYDEVLPLAMATAQKLIGNALEKDPDLMVSLVEQVLREVTSARKLVMWVAPTTKEVVTRARDHLATNAGIPYFTIESDDSLEPGDCIIETEVGRIDARIGIQLETILEALQSEEIS